VNVSRIRAAALSAFVAACAVGCETRTGDETVYGPVSSPPWTIGGVRPGMNTSEAERVLGTPTRSTTSYGRTTTTWNDIGVTFDVDGKAVDILGDRLNAPNGSLILQRGDSEAETVGRLGKGATKSAYRPSGSGVISCTVKRVGGEHVYEDATTRYTVSIYEDRLASVRAQPLAVPKR
jgi:transcription elongation factor